MNNVRRLSAISVAVALGATAAAPTASADPGVRAGFSIKTFASAPKSTTGADDVTTLDGHVFVGWQNGVGTKGEPNPTTGQTQGRLVEYSSSGKRLASWELAGKIDGVGGDPAHHRIIATVNEDGNSSLYTINPSAESGKQIKHYTYSPAPDSSSSGGVLTGGGTDAVSVQDGHVYLSASNPASPIATAVLEAKLNPETGVATLSATFADNATATDAVSGQPVKLALTDPDSNAVVPESSPRFAGQFALVSQADQEIIFSGHLEGQLTRLALKKADTSAGIDDVRWAASKHGALIVVDNGTGKIYAVRGNFTAGTAFGSLDSVGTTGQNNEVDTINLSTGALSPFVTGLSTAKGLAWLR